MVVSVVADCGSAGHGLHHAVEIEASRLLAGWKLAEALQLLPNKSRGGSKNKGAVNEPTAVLNALVFASLEGIASQIGYQRSAQLHERFAPHVEAVSVLFQEGKFPLVVTQRGDIALVRVYGTLQAANWSVGNMSSCEPMSLMIVPGLMTPGQRMKHGTR